jgi:hypothetical protein
VTNEANIPVGDQPSSQGPDRVPPIADSPACWLDRLRAAANFEARVAIAREAMLSGMSLHELRDLLDLAENLPRDQVD